MYFFALSQAPPPVHMEMATKRPVTIVPISTPPSACGPRIRPTSIGTSTGRSAENILSLHPARVSMSTARPYSDLAVPGTKPAVSLHRRRRDGDAIEHGERVRKADGDAHGEHRPGGRLHRDTEAGDDVGGMSGGARVGDVLHRLELRAGVVLGDPDEEAGEAHADSR